MKTILLTSNDTEVGKTWVAGAIARHLLESGKTVKYVKPLETGLSWDASAKDSDLVRERCYPHELSSETLWQYELPIAPTSASEEALDLDTIIPGIEAVNDCEYRIIEGIGGAAVPLDHKGRDIHYLLEQIDIAYTVLVVENRLGSISQAKLLDSYIPGNLTKKGFWLNDLTPPDPRVNDSNFENIAKFDTPIWGHQKYKQAHINMLQDFLC